MFQDNNEYIENDHKQERLSDSQILARIENLDRIVNEKDALLAKMHPFIVELMEARHFEHNLSTSSFLDGTHPIADQLYDEPTYNQTFVWGIDPQTFVEGMDPRLLTGDLNARRGKEFADADSYGEGEYTKVILKAAQALGFVAPEVPSTPSDPIDAKLGIADSYLEPIEEPVEAVVIPTAKSISNPMRIRDAIRNIENGKIKTDKVIIASCDRPVDDDERAKMEAIGFNYGNTEFESGIASFNDFAGTNFDPKDAEPFFVEIGGVLREGKKLVRKVELSSGTIELIALSAPYDPNRRTGTKPDGTPQFATRANTPENLLAANEFLPDKPGLIALESHDVWAKSQAEIADQTLGSKGKRTIATGPFKLDRLMGVDGEEPVLNRPGEVVDEIAKVYTFATQTRVSVLNSRQKLVDELENRLHAQK
jgi:hypothetical protein